MVGTSSLSFFYTEIVINDIKQSCTGLCISLGLTIITADFPSFYKLLRRCGRILSLKLIILNRYLLLLNWRYKRLMILQRAWRTLASCTVALRHILLLVKVIRCIFSAITIHCWWRREILRRWRVIVAAKWRVGPLRHCATLWVYYLIWRTLLMWLIIHLNVLWACNCWKVLLSLDVLLVLHLFLIH